MQRNKFQILKKYPLSISEKFDQDLQENINSLNVFRMKILCAGFVLLGLLMFFIDYNVLMPQKKLDLHTYYLWFDAILSGIGMVSYLCLMGVKTWFDEKKEFQNGIVFLTSLTLLIWAGAVGALEYFTHGSVSTIIICVLILATAMYLKSRQITIIYLATLVVFVICKKVFSDTQINFFVDHINLIPLIAFGWLLSRILYVNKIESLVNQREILNKNRQLAGEINIRKKTQEELEKIHKELEQRVLERTQELSTLNSELKNEISAREKVQNKLNRAQKMELIGTMASGIAHDLNNVLSGIITYPDLLLLDMPKDDPMRKSLETIRQSGQKAADIIQDMLMLARRGVPVKEVVNLNEVINEYLNGPEFYQLNLIHKNIKVSIFLEKNCPGIKGSKNHLSTTIMNIVTNAAESMPKGGTLDIQTKIQVLDKSMDMCKVVKEGTYIKLSVKDTGSGIKKEDQLKIFEPFYTNKNMGKSGTGLGMALVWGTVKDHGGYIQVKSQVNEGTTFVLYFPIARQSVAVYEKPVIKPIVQGKGENILIVDDLEDQLFFATSILKKFNYTVHCALSGEKAIEFMKENTVDLMILDMNMDPGINGLETYKEILKFHPDQKAIIATGFAQEDLIRKAKKVGIHSYIKKPYSLTKLNDAVRGELSKLSTA